MAPKAWERLSQVLEQVSSQLGHRQAAQHLPLSYYDLIEMFEQPGCAVCNLLLRDADRLLDTILYELALDPEIHRAIRARRGLCNEHSWRTLQYRGMSLGTAILFKTALDEVLQIIENTPLEGEGGRAGLLRWWGKASQRLPLAERLESTGPCIVCELVAGAEQRYVRTLSQYMADPRMRDAYQASDGLCLPHFRQTLLATTDSSSQKQLASIQRAVLLRLKGNLDRLIDKSDYQHSHEITETEGTSWRRVIRINGERGVFGPDLDVKRFTAR